MDSTSGPPMGGGLKQSLELLVPGLSLGLGFALLWAKFSGDFQLNDYQAVAKTVGEQPILALSLILVAYVIGALWATIMSDLESRILDNKSALAIYGGQLQDARTKFNAHWNEYVHTLSSKHNTHISRMVSSFHFMWRSWGAFTVLGISICLAFSGITNWALIVSFALIIGAIIAFVGSLGMHKALAAYRKDLLEGKFPSPGSAKCRSDDCDNN